MQALQGGKFGVRGEDFVQPAKRHCFHSKWALPQEQKTLPSWLTYLSTETYFRHFEQENSPSSLRTYSDAMATSPGLKTGPESCEPVVAIRLQVSKLQKMGSARVPGLFFLRVDLNSLINSPGILRSFSSLQRKATLTSRA